MFAKRKTSDIQRLAKQYQTQSTGLTGEYETAFAGYQKSAAEQLAPFEQAMRQYQEVDNPAYESSKSAYEKKLDQFNTSLREYKANPTERIQNQKWVGSRGNFFDIEGVRYSLNVFNAPKDISVKYEGGIPVAYRDKQIPTFTDKAPSAPTAPTAPKIDPFNEEPFTRKREELQTTYQRELAERKSARLGAARRGSTRPMLQGE